MYYLECPECGKKYNDAYVCECGSVLLVKYKKLDWKPKGNGVWRYKFALPFKGREVSMGEGETGLFKSDRKWFKKLYFKLEGDNPTDSFKDRGTTVVISKAKKEGYKEVGVASTGNMGASVAAYAAHAGLKTRVFVPKGTPKEKLIQISTHGAKIHEVNGTFSDCVNKLWAATKQGVYLAETGINPYYLEGEKTLGYELYEEMGVPDKIVVPIGTGGLTTAIYKAFKELKQMKKIRKMPQMIGVQAENCSPIIKAWETGEKILPCHNAKTIASAIKVKSPFNGKTAINAINESKGIGVTVTEREIVRGIKELGKEGVFAEPSSATTFAALKKIEAKKDEKIVLAITGHGLKDVSSWK